MKLFWFIRQHLAIIGLAALSYISADQLAITAYAKQHRSQRVTAERLEMTQRFASAYAQLKSTGALDDR